MEQERQIMKEITAEYSTVYASELLSENASV